MLADGSVEIHVRPIQRPARGWRASPRTSCEGGSMIRVSRSGQSRGAATNPGTSIPERRSCRPSRRPRTCAFLGRTRSVEPRPGRSFRMADSLPGGHPKTAEEAAARTEQSAMRMDTAIRFGEVRDASFFAPLTSRPRATVHEWLGVNGGRASSWSSPRRRFRDGRGKRWCEAEAVRRSRWKPFTRARAWPPPSRSWARPTPAATPAPRGSTAPARPSPAPPRPTGPRAGPGG